MAQNIVTPVAIELSSTYRVACPRCGYDQRGVIATWKDSCPLQGTCSECGLQLMWAEVIVPNKFEPQWCVEFATLARRVPVASAKTLAMSFWPWRFWSRLQMSHPVRKHRLAAYLCFLLVLLSFGYAVAQGTLAARLRHFTQQQYLIYPRNIQWQIRYEQSHVTALQTAKAVKAMPQEQREQAIAASVPQGTDSQKNYSDLVMALVSSSDEWIETTIQTKQRTLAKLSAQASAVPIIRMTYVGAMFEAIFLPLKSRSSGSILLGDGTVFRYPAPREMYDLIGSMRSGTGSWSDDLGVHVLLSALSVLGLLMLMPVTFILLPVSRRRAKVRWSHVARIFVYSLFAFVVLVLCLIGASSIFLFTDSQFALRTLRVLPLFGWIAVTIWWAVAIKRYLKMPHAGAVAAIMSFMLALLMSPILIVVLPERLTRLLFS